MKNKYNITIYFCFTHRSDLYLEQNLNYAKAKQDNATLWWEHDPNMISGKSEP